jgi:hypothetical protein
MGYKKEIIRLLNQINDEKFLKKIYTLICIYIERARS